MNSIKTNFNVSSETSTITQFKYHWTSWAVLEKRMKSRFPPTSLEQLTDILIKKNETIFYWRLLKKLYDSIPKRIEAVLKANTLLINIVYFLDVYIILSTPWVYIETYLLQILSYIYTANLIKRRFHSDVSFTITFHATRDSYI